MITKTNYLELLEKKYSSVVQSNPLSFNDIKAKVNIMGVYIIYSSLEEVIYIGSTNKFNIRFGTDLKYESTHNLVNKLLKSSVFSSREFAVSYIMNQCKFRIEECATKREAESLEHFSIWALNQKYN